MYVTFYENVMCEKSFVFYHNVRTTYGELSLVEIELLRKEDVIALRNSQIVTRTKWDH